MYSVLESIEERLKVVQDKDLGTSNVALQYPSNDTARAHLVIGARRVPNLNAALHRRQARTGTWFLESAHFVK